MNSVVAKSRMSATAPYVIRTLRANDFANTATSVAASTPANGWKTAATRTATAARMYVRRADCAGPATISVLWCSTLISLPYTIPLLDSVDVEVPL